MLLVGEHEEDGWIQSTFTLTYRVAWEQLLLAVYGAYRYFSDPEVLVDGKPVVNLPGPFIAAYHGFEWCIGALVSYCLHQPRPERRTLEATLDGDLPGSDKISLLCSLDVRLGSDGGYVAHPIDFRQSSSARTAHGSTAISNRHPSFRSI